MLCVVCAFCVVYATCVLRALLQRALAALTSKDEKTLLLMYDDLSSTVSNRTRSFDLGRKYLDVHSKHNRYFSADVFISSYAMKDENKQHRRVCALR